MKSDKQHDDTTKNRGNDTAPTGTSSKKRDAQRKNTVDTQINNVINRKFYFMTFLIVFLAVGYPLILTFIFQQKSKNDSINKVSDDGETSYKDCSDYFRDNYRADGIYEIQPSGRARFNVFCDMTAGGYAVIFRRNVSNTKTEFQVPMKAYKAGFGDLNTNHFLGLEYIHLLTRNHDNTLLATFDDKTYKYNRFTVSNEFYQYKLIIDEEITPMPDGTTLLRLNNTRFSTIDVDYDLALNSNCSSAWKAGWWFTNCFDYSACATCLIMHGNKGVTNLKFVEFKIK